MDWSRTPSLNSLRAFAVLAETGGYTVAAQRLNVTHAAISQQVKALESRLGATLALREGRGIRLTEVGRALARDLNAGFEIIGLGLDRVTEASAGQPVQVTMSPAFAVEWLMPRIAEFQTAHPDITLLLNPTAERIELKPGGIDVAIRYRDRRRPVKDLMPILISDMVIVGTPALIGDHHIEEPASLVDLPWLQELGTNEVAEWLTYRGVVPDKPPSINQMPGNLIMSAVRRGDGITYTARAFFRDELDAGTMVELFSEPAFGLYYLEAASNSHRPAVKTFIDWLSTKAEEVVV